MEPQDKPPVTDADAKAVLYALTDPLDWSPYYPFRGSDALRGALRRLQAQGASAQIPGLFEWLHGDRNTIVFALTPRGSYGIQARRRLGFFRVYVAGFTATSPLAFSRHPHSFTRLDDAKAACQHHHLTGSWE